MAKESLNKVNVSGKIVEIVSREGTNAKGMAYIAGTVVVETGPDNLIPVGFYANAKTNAGKDNAIYKSLQTVAKEYKTITEHGREAADMVEIKDSKISENLFFVAEDRHIRGFQINSAFFNRKQNITPGNSFIITGDIVSISRDVDKDDVPLDTLTVRLLVVGYGDKGNILDFKVKDPAGMKYIESVFDVDMEVKVSGYILIKENIEELSEEAAFGDAIITMKRKVDRELVITSATPPIDSSISQEERKTIIAQRQSEINAKKEKWVKDNQNAGKTSNSGKTTQGFTL